MANTGITNPKGEAKEQLVYLLFSVGRSLLSSTSRRPRDPLEMVVDELADIGLGTEKGSLVGSSGVEKLRSVMFDESQHDCADSGYVHRNAGSAKEFKVLNDGSDKLGKQCLEDESGSVSKRFGNERLNVAHQYPAARHEPMRLIP